MFPTVLVDLATATICFLSTCYPALIGVNTPSGEFTLQHYETKKPGYGGDILVFYEPPNDEMVYALHRIINVQGQNRLMRIKSTNPSDRTAITSGCINVEPFVYDKLVDCCSMSTIIILQ